jgi:hypothetical protein
MLLKLARSTNPSFSSHFGNMSSIFLKIYCGVSRQVHKSSDNVSDNNYNSSTKPITSMSPELLCVYRGFSFKVVYLHCNKLFF